MNRDQDNEPHGDPPEIEALLTSVTVGDFKVRVLARDTALNPTGVMAALSGEERAHAQSISSAPRREEYLRSRYMIRQLTSFGGPLSRSPQGVPNWPPGLVGSLSHKDGHVAVVLAESTRWLAVGLDAEDTGRMKTGFEPRLAADTESRLLTKVESLTARSRTDWLTVLFSVKEALFKSHFPIGGVMFHFLDAELLDIEPVDAECGKVSIRVLCDTSPVSPAGSVWRGAYRFHRIGAQTLVLSSVGVPHPA